MKDYAIPDEPRPGRLGHLVVRPSAPLLALMLCGAWVAWPWYIFNAIALGSPTRRREIALSVGAVAGTAVLGVVVIALVDAGVIESTTAIRLALLAIATWKIGMAYAISTLQARTFHVYEYYGGRVRNPNLVLIGGFILRGAVIGLVDSTLWRIIVAGYLAKGGL